MLGIREWLSSRGLSEYADRFAENRIDLSILSDLTGEDLKELGIFLGDRRRILRLIAEFAPEPESLAMPGSRPLEEAERRQVTAMFADLVGSTSLARLDVEVRRSLVNAYLEEASASPRELDAFDGGDSCGPRRPGLAE